MHIILYVLDALRADHLGCYGYERDVSPNIDDIANEGVVFENCFTASTWTRPSAASILTGTYPAVHLTCSRQDMFSTPLIRLPEVLRAGGFNTAAFSTMGNLASEIGFIRGFDLYHDLFRESTILAKRRRRKTVRKELLDILTDDSAGIALPNPEDINDFLLPWLEQNRRGHTFSFIWSIETHAPYIAPSEFRRFSPPSASRPDEGWPEDIRNAGLADRQRLINLYDDEIYYNDHCLGQIVNHLKALDIYDNTLFIIISDHGEAFYEHGMYGHGYLPYEEVIHVPMVMKFPGQQYAGQRAAGLAELIDIFPTIMAVAGLDFSPEDSTFVQGHNLLELMEARSSQVREYTFSDTHSSDMNNSDHYRSVRNEDWKYVRLERRQDSCPLTRAVKRLIKRDVSINFRSLRNYLHRNYITRPGEYLFNLKADPAEKSNLISKYPEVASRLRHIVESQDKRNNSLAEQIGNSSDSFKESETVRRHLEDLGYL